MRLKLSPFLKDLAFKPHERRDSEEEGLQKFLEDLYGLSPDYKHSTSDTSEFQKQFKKLIDKLVILADKNSVIDSKHINSILPRTKADLQNNLEFGFVGNNIEDRKQEAVRFFRDMKKKLEFVCYKISNSNDKQKIFSSLTGFVSEFLKCSEGVSNAINFAYKEWTTQESFSDMLFVFRNYLLDEESTNIKFEEKVPDTLQSHIDTGLERLLRDAKFDVVCGESKDPYLPIVSGYHPRMKEGAHRVLLRYSRKNILSKLKNETTTANLLRIRNIYNQVDFYKKNGLGMQEMQRENEKKEMSLYQSFLNEMQPLLTAKIVTLQDLVSYVDDDDSEIGEVIVNEEFIKNRVYYIHNYLINNLIGSEIKEIGVYNHQLLPLLEKSLTEKNSDKAKAIFGSYVENVLINFNFINDINVLTYENKQIFLEALIRGEIDLVEKLLKKSFINFFENSEKFSIFEIVIFDHHKIYEKNEKIFLLKLFLNKWIDITGLKINDDLLSHIIDILNKSFYSSNVSDFKKFFIWPKSLSLKIFNLICLFSPKIFKNIFFSSSETEKDHLLSSIFLNDNLLSTAEYFDNFFNSLFQDMRNLKSLPVNTLNICSFDSFKIILKKITEHNIVEISNDLIDVLIDSRQWNKIKYLLISLKDKNVLNRICDKLRAKPLYSEFIEDVLLLANVVLKNIPEMSTDDLRIVYDVENELKGDLEFFSDCLYFYHDSNEHKKTYEVLRIISPNNLEFLSDNLLISWIDSVSNGPVLEFNKLFIFLISLLKKMKQAELKTVLSSMMELKPSERFIKILSNLPDFPLDIEIKKIDGINKTLIHSLYLLSVDKYIESADFIVNFINMSDNKNENLLFLIKIIVNKFGFSDDIREAFIKKIPKDLVDSFKENYPSPNVLKQKLITDFVDELTKYDLYYLAINKNLLIENAKLKLIKIYGNNKNSESGINEGINKIEFFISLERFYRNYKDCVSKSGIDYLRSIFLKCNFKNMICYEYFLSQLIPIIGEYYGFNLLQIQAHHFYKLISIFTIVQARVDQIDSEDRIEKLDFCFRQLSLEIKQADPSNKFSRLITLSDFMVKKRKLIILTNYIINDFHDFVKSSDKFLDFKKIKESLNIIFEKMVKLSKLNDYEEIRRIRDNFNIRINQIIPKDSKFSDITNDSSSRVAEFNYGYKLEIEMSFKFFTKNVADLENLRNKFIIDNKYRKAISKRVELYKWLADLVATSKTSLDYRSKNYIEKYMAVFSDHVKTILDKQKIYKDEKEKLLNYYCFKLTSEIKPENYIFSNQPNYFAYIHFLLDKYSVSLKYLDSKQVDILKNDTNLELKKYIKTNDIPSYTLSHYFDKIKTLADKRQLELNTPSRSSSFTFLARPKSKPIIDITFSMTLLKNVVPDTKQVTDIQESLMRLGVLENCVRSRGLGLGEGFDADPDRAMGSFLEAVILNSITKKSGATTNSELIDLSLLLAKSIAAHQPKEDTDTEELRAYKALARVTKRHVIVVSEGKAHEPQVLKVTTETKETKSELPPIYIKRNTEGAFESLPPFDLKGETVSEIILKVGRAAPTVHHQKHHSPINLRQSIRAVRQLGNFAVGYRPTTTISATKPRIPSMGSATE